jgi:transcriptional regulator with XRE-family HTH domain
MRPSKEPEIPTPAAKQGHNVARAFGAVLRAARVQCGLTQDRLGTLANLDRTYPSLLERGLRQPTLAMLLRLATALNVEPQRLVADTVALLRGEAL